MVTTDDYRRQMIRSVLLRQQDPTGDGMILPWRQLDEQLTAIIGQAGFSALFARSIHLTRPLYPMLPSAQAPFAQLETCLGRLPREGAIDINIALLTVFVDTLTLLIGGPLTTTLLQSAWGDDTVNPAGKEPQS